MEGLEFYIMRINLRGSERWLSRLGTKWKAVSKPSERVSHQGSKAILSPPPNLPRQGGGTA